VGTPYYSAAEVEAILSGKKEKEDLKNLFAGKRPNLRRMKFLRLKDWLRIPKSALEGLPQGGVPVSLARLWLPGPALLFQHPEAGSPLLFVPKPKLRGAWMW
jgi:hypothetical protein